MHNCFSILIAVDTCRGGTWKARLFDPCAVSGGGNAKLGSIPEGVASGCHDIKRGPRFHSGLGWSGFWDAPLLVASPGLSSVE